MAKRWFSTGFLATLIAVPMVFSHAMGAKLPVPVSSGETGPSYESGVSRNPTYSGEPLSLEMNRLVQADLAFLFSIQLSGETPLHKKMYPKVDGVNQRGGEQYQAFFGTRVHSFQVSNYRFANGSSGQAFVYPGQNVMYIGSDWNAGLSMAARLGIYLHEARHVDGMGRHDSCPSNFKRRELSGQNACDETLEGSYAADVVFHHHLAQYCTNCNEKMKMDAEFYRDEWLNHIIGDGNQARLRADLSPR